MFRVRQTATSANLRETSPVPSRSKFRFHLKFRLGLSIAELPVFLQVSFFSQPPLSPALAPVLPALYRGIKIQLTFDYGFRGAAISLR